MNVYNIHFTLVTNSSNNATKEDNNKKLNENYLFHDINYKLKKTKQEINKYSKITNFVVTKNTEYNTPSNDKSISHRLIEKCQKEFNEILLNNNVQKACYNKKPSYMANTANMSKHTISNNDYLSTVSSYNNTSLQYPNKTNICSNYDESSNSLHLLGSPNTKQKYNENL